MEPAHILANLATAVIVMDHDGGIDYLNESAEGLLAISLRQAAGLKLATLVDAPELEELLSRAAQTGQPYSATDLRIRLRDNPTPEAIVDCHVSELETATDGTLLVELEDITRRHRINREHALIQQHNVTRTIVKQLAHEVRNPLGGVRGAAQLLARRMSDEELVSYTQVIISETDRLTSLLDGMLGPGVPLNPQESNIHELLQHVQQLVRAEAPEEIEIATDYDPSLPKLSLDRNQIIQALLNLARNAVQAMGEQGRLVFRTRVQTHVTIGEHQHRLVASIEFEDNGPGVPEALRDTLFFPLVTGRGDGTGLGLPLAQELINRHGGLIEFRSRPERTIFQILLPIGTEA